MRDKERGRDERDTQEEGEEKKAEEKDHLNWPV